MGRASRYLQVGGIAGPRRSLELPPAIPRGRRGRTRTVLIRIRIAAAIVAALVTVSTNGYGASLKQIRQLPWTDDSATSLAVALPDKSAVIQFIRDLLNHSDQFEFANVGDYQFVDLERSGILSLVCTLDFGGRSLHTMILVVTKRGNEFIHDQVESNGWEIDALEQRIVDLRDDGYKEVLVTRLDGQYRGARPTATFTDVFKVEGGRLVKADQEFPEYYEKTVLPDLRKKLDGLAKQQPSQDPSSENNRQEEIATLQHQIAAVSAIVHRRRNKNTLHENAPTQRPRREQSTL